MRQKGVIAGVQPLLFSICKGGTEAACRILVLHILFVNMFDCRVPPPGYEKIRQEQSPLPTRSVDERKSLIFLGLSAVILHS
jgi:hypothetical protein